jgi:hypothetical protein
MLFAGGIRGPVILTRRHQPERFAIKRCGEVYDFALDPPGKDPLPLLLGFEEVRWMSKRVSEIV